MLMDLLGVLATHVEASKNALSNKIQLAVLPLEAFCPREVDGPAGEEGAAREDEGAPLEDDAPGAEADVGG